MPKGSSRGIGRELARTFARENAKVVINYIHNEKSANELMSEIMMYNKNCISVRADISKKEDVLLLYKKTCEAFGKVDILINNAGICDDNLLHFMSEEQWYRTIDINLSGTFLCSKIFSKAMIKQKEGKIFNIASLKGVIGCEGQTNYTASKAGMIGFTKALAKEVGVFNLSINAICPGFIITDLNRHNKEKIRTAQEKSVLSVDYALADLLNFMVLLCSDSIRGVSGQVFNLDSRIK